MPAAPLLDREFLEKLERLTIHWQKSFPGLVGGHNVSRFAGSGPGISRPSQFPSRRRSARRQLARLHAPGKALPQDVPGGAARAGASAGRFERFHDGVRRRKVRLRAQAGRVALLRRPGAARQHRDPRIFQAPDERAFSPLAAGTASMASPNGLMALEAGRRRPIIRRWCASSSAPIRSAAC